MYGNKCVLCCNSPVSLSLFEIYQMVGVWICTIISLSRFTRVLLLCMLLVIIPKKVVLLSHTKCDQIELFWNVVWPIIPHIICVCVCVCVPWGNDQFLVGSAQVLICCLWSVNIFTGPHLQPSPPNPSEPEWTQNSDYSPFVQPSFTFPRAWLSMHTVVVYFNCVEKVCVSVYTWACMFVNRYRFKWDPSQASFKKKNLSSFFLALFFSFSFSSPWYDLWCCLALKNHRCFLSYYLLHDNLTLKIKQWKWNRDRFQENAVMRHYQFVLATNPSHQHPHPDPFFFFHWV